MALRLWCGAASLTLAGLTAYSVPTVGFGIAGGGALALLAVSVLGIRRWWRSRLVSPVRLAAVAALVSLGFTAALLVWPPPPLHNAAAAWCLTEVVSLLTFAGFIVRQRCATGGYVAALVVVAVSVLPLRVTAGADPPASALELAVLGLLGFLPALGVVIVGGYLRVLDDRRVRAVAQTRRDERLRLAYDLHDYIGHDLSGIVLEAQAAGLAPDREATALARIEAAGQSALATMDRTLRILRDDDPNDRLDDGAHPHGLGDLETLAQRFALRTGVTATVTVEPGLADRLPRELGAALYRISVESLTNVQRHAVSATTVAITVRTIAGVVRASVTDDGARTNRAAARRRGGLGLIGLKERVDLTGGEFTAGWRAPTGWEVAATLPLPPERATR